MVDLVKLLKTLYTKSLKHVYVYTLQCHLNPA